MRFEELRVEGKELGVQNFLDSREVKRRVFRPWMVTMNQQCSQSKERKKKKILQFQTEAPRMARMQSTITILFLK